MPTPTTVEGALIAALLSDAGSPSVQSIVVDRVRPFTDALAVPTPRLTYQRWGTELSVDDGGFTNDGPTGHEVARFQVDAWADDLMTAMTLARAVKRRLNGYADDDGPVPIRCVRVVDMKQQPAAIEAGREKAPQRVTLDVRVSYLETA